ncbi:MAG: hydantoinase/oxoprolinase family protein [Pseudomonadota bacterium]
MLLGIDVGGTHTDAVVVDGGGILAWAKVRTDHDNLLRPIRTVLKEILSQVDPKQIKRLNISTTLSTNSIIEGKTEEVGLLVASGPGIDPEYHRIGRHYHVLSGSIDHRGANVQALDPAEIQTAAEACRRDGIKVFAAAVKFSTRNPEQENQIAEALKPYADYITKGHALSGLLNFPRRVATACFNSAVWRVYNDFAWAVGESVEEFGLETEVNVLKADGGTIPLDASRDAPVETILSGPAASVMGIIALCDVREDSIILDIGGTTTDIAVFADGAPVIENEGMTVGSYPTLVRALKIKSIGVGGDSIIRVSSSGVTVGPERYGPCLAAAEDPSASVPALTDAMNRAGLFSFGDQEASCRGIEELARTRGLPSADLAESAVEYAVEKIRRAALDLVDEINEKPVYTIHELLQGKVIVPQKVYLMGGPALSIAGRLSEAMGLEVIVPEHFSYANAVGAAVTRTTMEIQVFADTEKGHFLIPTLGVRKTIGRDFTQRQAEEEAAAALTGYLHEIGAGDQGLVPEITESESFEMVKGPSRTGRNIRVKCQVKPGVNLTFAPTGAGGDHAA